VLEVLAEVYKHDAESRERALSPEARLAHHVELSKPLLDELEGWLEAQLEEKKVEPNSSLGGAINYTLNRWEELTLFLREPGAPLDNNVCERALKKAILHRRNSPVRRTPPGSWLPDCIDPPPFKGGQSDPERAALPRRARPARARNQHCRPGPAPGRQAVDPRLVAV